MTAYLPAPPRGGRRADQTSEEQTSEDQTSEEQTSEDQLVRVLFEAARQRRRRIRLSALAVILTLAVAVAAIIVGWPGRTAAGRAGGGLPASAVAAWPRSPAVAWVDWAGRVHVGELASRTQHVVAKIDADAAAPVVAAGAGLYLVNQAGGYLDGAFWPATIEELNLGTGKITDVAPGEWVFPAPGGHRLYVSQTDNSIAEVPVSGSGAATALPLPAGWYLPGGDSLAVANGILVQSRDGQPGTAGPPAALAVWNPLTAAIKIVGRAAGYAGAAIGAYTPPGAGYSLLAWMPASCRFPVHCPVRITNTVTMGGVTLRSPLGYGFAVGGAFSPDGRQLAVFVNASPGTGGGSAELAIVDTRTGALRLVPGARFLIGEDVAWARWLPGGKRLIAGSGGPDYVVTASTLTAEPFSFRRGDGYGQMNYSVTPLPGRG